MKNENRNIPGGETLGWIDVNMNMMQQEELEWELEKNIKIYISTTLEYKEAWLSHEKVVRSASFVEHFSI